jgi:hypothetical protein
MKSQGLVWAFVLLTISFAPSHAQRRSDPLSPAEIDKLRDQAQEPNLRLKLFVEFARNRLDAIDKVRSDPKVTDRGVATHERLQDFLDVYDEMNENIDAFEDQKADLRKVLKLVCDADVEFQAKLRAFQTSESATKDGFKTYEFLLQTALETVDGSAKDHRQLLAEQEESAKHRKKSNR